MFFAQTSSSARTRSRASGTSSQRPSSICDTSPQHFVPSLTKRCSLTSTIFCSVSSTSDSVSSVVWSKNGPRSFAIRGAAGSSAELSSALLNLSHHIELLTSYGRRYKGMGDVLLNRLDGADLEGNTSARAFKYLNSCVEVLSCCIDGQQTCEARCEYKRATLQEGVVYIERIVVSITNVWPDTPDATHR